MSSFSIHLKNDSDTVALGKQIADACLQPLVIYLIGELGAGKTTLTRGVVTGFGHKGNVKSPTYTLVEPYELKNWQVNHFDLYRLGDPEELEFIGIRDYFHNTSVNLIEWPQKGEGILPEADMIVELSYHGTERIARLSGQTDAGELLLSSMTK